MKFISKQSNYRVVLSHGQPAEPLTGRIAVPGLYIKFEGGIANIVDEKTIEKMKNHPAYNIDFIASENDETKDPWIDYRIDKEPEHDILNIKHGEVAESLNPKPKIQLPKDKQKILKDMAQEMAMQMAPQLAKELLEKLVSTSSNDNMSNKKNKDNLDIDDKKDTTTTEKVVQTNKVK